MRMTSEKRAIDKIYRRRDRYEIPDWQRQSVWNRQRQQHLIDSILRGWTLPKFYFVKTDEEDQYEVVDGQQRLTSIFEFFDNNLPLSDDTAQEFGGRYHRDLPTKAADQFDDYEIQYDLIEDAADEDLKLFFQRLQNGLPLTSSEKLNSVDSKLRDFIKELTQDSFFESVAMSDRRYGHFDVLAKVAALEIEGIDAGLRYDDLKAVLDSNKSFSPKSRNAQRIRAALKILNGIPTELKGRFRNRTFVQSAITLTCSLVDSIKDSPSLQKHLAAFLGEFLAELNHQIEMGSQATDRDYPAFQRTVNANVKRGARIRQQVLMRKLLFQHPEMSDNVDALALAEVASAGAMKSLVEDIVNKVAELNSAYSAKNGEDLFKPTNKTVQAQHAIAIPLRDLSGYSDFIDNLYFLFHEGPSTRLVQANFQSFVDIRDLRTDLQHDIDHGSRTKVKAKRKKIGKTFEKYSGVPSPTSLDPERFVVVQMNLLSAVRGDLNRIGA